MSTSAPACSAITGPITDTTTYTYSDLNNGFTPPKSCLEPSYTSLQAGGFDPVFEFIQTVTVGGNVTSSVGSLKVYRGRDPACFPPHYPSTCEWQGTMQQQQHYVYSPASCPGGYESATATVDQSLTRATCCPSGFALSSVRVNRAETFWGDPVSCTSVGTSVNFEGTPTTLPDKVLTMYAPTVVVAWQGSDIARWRTALPTSTSGGSGSSSEPAGSSSGGLSTGAKAGIGIGCAFALVAILAILLLFVRSRSRKRRAANHDVSITQPQTVTRSIVHEEKALPIEKIKPKPHGELGDDVALQEMTGHGKRNEADDKHTRAELP